MCAMCKKVPIIEGIKDTMYPDFCTDCKTKIVNSLKNRVPKVLEKLEKKISRRNW